MKRCDPANYSFHAGSLTAGESRRAVTKSPDGKPCLYLGEGTHSQSEWQGNDAGRRITNVRRHRKGNPASITGRAGNFGLRRPCVRCGKSDIAGEENGYEHPATRRCKRRWHVSKVSSSNWGESALFRHKAKGTGTIQGLPCAEALNNHECEGWRSPSRSEKKERLGIIEGIRRKAEIPRDAVQRVGDGHSSLDGKDNITLPMRRAISATAFSKKQGGQR